MNPPEKMSRPNFARAVLLPQAISNFGPDPRGMNRPPVLFPLPDFARNLSTSVQERLLLIQAFLGAFGGSRDSDGLLHLFFYTCRVYSVGDCHLWCDFFKMSCWYWTLSVFVKLLFCINTTFDKHF